MSTFVDQKHNEKINQIGATATECAKNLISGRNGITKDEARAVKIFEGAAGIGSWNCFRTRSVWKVQGYGRRY